MGGWTGCSELALGDGDADGSNDEELALEELEGRAIGGCIKPFSGLLELGEGDDDGSKELELELDEERLDERELDEGLAGSPGVLGKGSSARANDFGVSEPGEGDADGSNDEELERDDDGGGTWVSFS